MPTRLSELMQRCTSAPGHAALDVPDDWMQGRSAFGGLQSAIALRAMRTLVPDAPLRTLQVAFVAPVGERLEARANVLRAGKNATQVEARLGTGGATDALVVAVFGSPRDSIVAREWPRAEPMPVRHNMAYVAGVLPAFLQHFDVALLDGAAPFAGRPVTRSLYDIGLHDGGATTESHLMAICDFVPPVGLSWMPRPTPGTSLTWMLEMLDDDFAGQPLAGWRIDAEMVAARGGYTTQRTAVHAPDGRAIALSHQSMVVFG